jgi:plastocyanin
MLGFWRIALKKIVLVACVAVVGLAGCKPKEPAPRVEGPVASQSSAPRPMVALDPATTGAVSGTVHFNGKAPAPVKIDTSMDPACGIASTGDVFTEQYVVNAGKLANVFVYVKSGPTAAMNIGISSPEPVVLDQKGCQYTPHVIGVVQGGTVLFKNADVTMHNVHTMPTKVGNESIDISEGPRGMPQSKQFKTPELMIPVRCNNHPWMNAFINVSATPFFAVTDSNGHFDLSGLPAGTYTLGAVHEKLGEQTMTVTVTAKGSAKAEFSFEPKG